MKIGAGGSSPRVWGIQFHELLNLCIVRFIPTCVGNTVTRREPGGSGRGSSPRVWGIRDIHLRDADLFRFIPTCVGNTYPTIDNRCVLAVHPHVCGEYRWRATWWSMSTGSSPRVWGIPVEGDMVVNVNRFIPTCVGNTNHWVTFLRVTFRFIPTCVGNTCAARWVSVAVRRFIPTCVGNTLYLFTRISNAAGSSPRVWGILPRSSWSSPRIAGSSPRVWGIRIHDLADLVAERFIPTCVGNTFAGFISGLGATGSSPRVWGIRPYRSPPTTSAAVHPHVCGEYYIVVSALSGGSGSSPRVWGILNLQNQKAA